MSLQGITGPVSHRLQPLAMSGSLGRGWEGCCDDGGGLVGRAMWWGDEEGNGVVAWEGGLSKHKVMLVIEVAKVYSVYSLMRVLQWL